MINVHLLTNHNWIHALSIPLDDIQRFSLRPLKWLRYAAFAVLGAKGHLTETPGGEIVDYENVRIADLDDNKSYYFTPEGECHPVDVHALRDNSILTLTSDGTTQYRSNFCDKIARRDGNCCAVTRETSSLCDVAHIIPRSKSNEYIRFVFLDRGHLYQDQRFPPEDDININITENGIFLRADLRRSLLIGTVCFLRTPTFGLSPADIPGLENVSTDAMPRSRVTMKRIIPPVGTFPVPQMDVSADWSGPDAPPNILLDYMYGVTLIKHYATENIKSMLDEPQHVDLGNIPRPLHSPTLNDDCAKEDVGAGQRRHLKPKESALCKAMNMAFRFVRGHSPRLALDEMRKKQEERNIGHFK